MSLPSRERGLKLRGGFEPGQGDIVAPFTGAWIEISMVWPSRDPITGRSLHGSVD